MTLRFRFPERFLRALTCRAQVTAGVLFLALCFVSAFLEQGVRICVLSIAFFVSILVSCIFRIGKRKDAFLFALLCVIASGLACVSEAYTDLCFERPAQRLIEEGGEVRVSGRITRILSEGATDRVYFEAETIGEAPVSMGFLADLKAPDGKTLRVGDAIAAKAEIGDFPAQSAYIPGDLSRSARANGAFAYARLTEVRVQDRERPLFLRLYDRAGALLSELNDAPVLRAALLGDKQGLSEEIRFDFQTLGVSHLLALSGLHLSILCGAFYCVLRVLFLPKRVCAGASLAFATVYLLISGMPLSLLRAVGMLYCYHLSGAVFSKSSPVKNLVTAASVITFFSRYAVSDIGFLLSFFATLGIVLFVFRVERSLKTRLWYRIGQTRICSRILLRIFSAVLLSLCTTLSALCFTYPILVVSYGYLAAGAVFYQLILVPLFSLLLVCAVGYLAFSMLSLGAPAEWLFAATNRLSHAFLVCVRRFCENGFGSVYLRGAPGIVSAIVLIAGILFVILFRVRLRTCLLLPVFCALSFVLTLLVRAPFRADLSEAFRICGTSEESLVLRDQTRVIVFGPPGEAVGKVNYRYRRLCSYEGIDRIDALVIGRIDEFSAERLEALDAITPIDRICVPSGTRESWKQALLDAFSERVLFYSETEELRIGGVCVRRLSDRAYLIETQNETICYTGSDLSNGILLSDGRTPPDPATEDGILRIALG